MDEFELISKYFRPLCNNSSESQNLTDDVAVIHANSGLVISKDLIVEDVHFRLTDGAYNIAHRLLRSNLSDIAGSGSKPLYYMLGFSKNHNVDEKFLHDFSQALAEINKEFGIYLIGGDTVKAGNKLFFSLTIFGEKSDEILSRKNAQDGDLIFVSGNIGDAFLGRKITENELESAEKDYLISRYYKAEPRISLGQELIANKLSKSAIDISDGLLADLKHICQSSNLKATIFQEKIPLSEAAKNILKNNRNISILDLCCAGDDYELIFTVAPENSEKISYLANEIGVKLTNIGYLQTAKENDELINLFDHETKISIKKFGYEH